MSYDGFAHNHRHPRPVWSNPFSRSEWLEAVRQAPAIKKGFFTILSSRDCLDEIRSMLEDDAAQAGCFSE